MYLRLEAAIAHRLTRSLAIGRRYNHASARITIKSANHPPSISTTRFSAIARYAPMSTFNVTLTTPHNPPLLDWLVERLPEVPSDRLQTLLADGCLWLNGQPCTQPDQPLQLGDRLRLKFPPAPPLVWEPEPMSLSILYEDDWILIVNKPAGLVVHPSPGHRHGTLVNGLLAHSTTWPLVNGQPRPGIIHRLDRDTCGVIVFAKRQEAIAPLQSQFQPQSQAQFQPQASSLSPPTALPKLTPPKLTPPKLTPPKIAQRDYRAWIGGTPAQESGCIDAPIAQDCANRKRYTIVPEALGGRPARTHWRVVERSPGITALHLHLDTGRSHQIRVHWAAMGLPLVGDRLYDAPEPPSNHPLTAIFPGPWLQAWRLRVCHPITGLELEAIAPPLLSPPIQPLQGTSENQRIESNRTAERPIGPPYSGTPMAESGFQRAMMAFRTISTQRDAEPER